MPTTQSKQRSAQEIRDWHLDRVSRATGFPLHDIDAERPLLRYGLDSVAVVTLAAGLETWPGCRFHENPLDEQPTNVSLAAAFSGTGRGGAADL
jgi:acyl carrier protein